MENKKQVVAITGASAGLGRAIAREFGRHGASVGLIARGKEGLEGAQREIESTGGRALVCVVDVSDHEQVERAAERIEQELGAIDIWINNAMCSVFSPVKEMRPEEYKRVTEVNYLGYVYGTLSALKRMSQRNRGHIIQVGSALAYRSIPLQSAYCATKHAIVGFTDSLRCELIHDDSKVEISVAHLPAMNTTQFGWVLSRLPRKPQPVPPIYQPEVVAEAIYYLSQNPRREMWIGGPTVKAIVGQKAIPGILDYYLGKTGYDAQQYDGAPGPNRQDNVWQPVPGDHGAHGQFDSRSRNFSAQVWADEHRVALALGALGAGLLAAASAFGVFKYKRRETPDVRFRKAA
jgi:short-subunit dehydrogenase